MQPPSPADITALVAAAIAFIGVPATMCTCGHIADWALLGTVPLAALSWWSFVKGPANGLIWRFVRLTIVAAISLIMLKNAADTLWFGHQPVFRIPSLFLGYS